MALYELYQVSHEKRFLMGAIDTADWAVKRSCVPNWNYNSFSVYLLATAYRVTHDSKYLKAAKEKVRLGVLPGQLLDGPTRGVGPIRTMLVGLPLHHGSWADGIVRCPPR